MTAWVILFVSSVRIVPKKCLQLPWAQGQVPAQVSVLISVLHPTIRPEQAIRIREEWLARAEEPAFVEWIFCVREDISMEGAVAVPKTPDGLSTYT